MYMHMYILDKICMLSGQFMEGGNIREPVFISKVHNPIKDGFWKKNLRTEEIGIVKVLLCSHFIPGMERAAELNVMGLHLIVPDPAHPEHRSAAKVRRKCSTYIMLGGLGMGTK